MQPPLDLIFDGDYLTFIILAASLVGAISLHEYAHALAADFQGDRMPRAMGRVTPNPARHLDPMGTLAIVLVGFGWGKPVEFRPQALSSKRFGAAIVALAGPLMNVALATLMSFIFGLTRDSAPTFLFDFMAFFIIINVALAVFNLIPLPPLDGSRLLTIFLPPSKQKVIFFLDRYGLVILLAVVFLGNIGPGPGLLSSLLDPIIRWVLELILTITGAR